MNLPNRNVLRDGLQNKIQSNAHNKSQTMTAKKPTPSPNPNPRPDAPKNVLQNPIQITRPPPPTQSKRPHNPYHPSPLPLALPLQTRLSLHPTPAPPKTPPKTPQKHPKLYPEKMTTYNLPYLQIKKKKSPYTIVLFHANAEDIFDCEAFANDAGDFLNCTVYCPEY
jgi:hypothetical protein